MSLTAIQVKNLRCPNDRQQIKKSDGNGLFLLIKNGGSKLWRLRYKYAGKHQELALGKYPTISLSEAREMAEKARASLVQGINPATERRERKNAAKNPAPKFGELAVEWFERQKEGWGEDHSSKVERWIKRDMSVLSKMPIDHIDQGHLADLVLQLEKDGKARSASHIVSVINRIYGHALSRRLIRSNPAQGFPLSDVLKPLPKVVHRAAITSPKELGGLIYQIDTNIDGSYCTVHALRLIPRVFLRPKEVRLLKWEYVDFDDRLIRIPSEDMKRGREHVVPMASQVVELLGEVNNMTGYSEYVFPNQKRSDRPISKNVMTNRLRLLGYGPEEMSAHGFRSTASTLLHEQGWMHEAIEAQLAHLTGSAASRAYNRSIHIRERRKLMQAWADYLDRLREESING